MTSTIQSSLQQFLENNFTVWSHLSVSEQKEMLKNISQVHYEKGEKIHQGDSDCIGVLMVKKGMLRVYMLSEEGKEITLYRMVEGDICVLSASCILSNITFDVHVDSEESTDVLLLNSQFFSHLSEKNIYAECYMYKLAVDRFSDVMWSMQQILFMSMDKRLAVFLWDELAKNDSNIIKLTHEQVAKYMGSAREVVSRMLKYFANEGIVELSRGGIKIIDKEKLSKLIRD